MNLHRTDDVPVCFLADQLQAYHDGELPAVYVPRFEAHLAQCPECTLELARLRRMGEMLRQAAEVPLDPALLQRIHRRIDQAPDQAVLRTLTRLAAAAAVVLVVCGIQQVGVTRAEPAPAAAGDWELTAVAVRSDEQPVAAGSPRLVNWFYHELSQDTR